MAKKHKQGNIQKIPRDTKLAERKTNLLFYPASITFSDTAQQILDTDFETINSVIEAHCSGSWPLDDPHDCDVNLESISRGVGDVMSIHKIGDITIWVKTLLPARESWVGTPDEYF